MMTYQQIQEALKDDETEDLVGHWVVVSRDRKTFSGIVVDGCYRRFDIFDVDRRTMWNGLTRRNLIKINGLVKNS